MRRRSRAWIREADVVLFPSRRRSPPPPPNGPFRLAGGGFFWTPPHFSCPRPRHQAISLPGTLVSIPRGPALDLKSRRRPIGPLGRPPLGQSGGTVRPVPVGHLELGVRKPSWNNVVVRSARNKDRKTAFFRYSRLVTRAVPAPESFIFRPVEEYLWSADSRTVPNVKGT